VFLFRWSETVPDITMRSLVVQGGDTLAVTYTADLKHSSVQWTDTICVVVVVAVAVMVLVLVVVLLHGDVHKDGKLSVIKVNNIEVV
jgi:hypothetical protein